jgi:hypothetical protein
MKKLVILERDNNVFHGVKILMHKTGLGFLAWELNIDE